MAVQRAIDKPFNGMFSGRINFLPLRDVVGKRAAGFSISRDSKQTEYMSKTFIFLVLSYSSTILTGPRQNGTGLSVVKSLFQIKLNFALEFYNIFKFSEKTKQKQKPIIYIY